MFIVFQRGRVCWQYSTMSSASFRLGCGGKM
jgi:hypothetical protein